jgi:hypothetical protein
MPVIKISRNLFCLQTSAERILKKPNLQKDFDFLLWGNVLAGTQDCVGFSESLKIDIYNTMSMGTIGIDE